MHKRTSLHITVETMRAVSQALLRERRLGARASDVLLLMGVMVGEAEGKLLSAYKLSGYVGLPYPTALRRLARLQRDGLVERDHRKAYSLTEKARVRAARMPYT